MIAIYILGKIFFWRWIETNLQSRFDFGEKRVGGPALAEKKKIQPRALPALAQDCLIAEEFNDAAYHGDRLLLTDKSVQLDREVRLRRQSSAHPHGIADLGAAAHGGQSNFVDLGIRAPDGAACNGDLELARQIVKLRIARKLTGQFQRQRRSIDDLVRRNAGQRATSHIAHHISASALRG